MKTLITFLSLTFLFTILATPTSAVRADEMINIEGELVKTFLPGQLAGVDTNICLTLIDQQGKLTALIEDVAFCYYARKLKLQRGQQVMIESETLEREADPQLLRSVAKHFPDAHVIILETE